MKPCKDAGNRATTRNFLGVNSADSRNTILSCTVSDRLGLPMKKLSTERRQRNPEGRKGQPVSLHPLDFDEAVAGLAQVKMPEQAKNEAEVIKPNPSGKRSTNRK